MTKPPIIHQPNASNQQKQPTLASFLGHIILFTGLVFVFCVCVFSLRIAIITTILVLALFLISFAAVYLKVLREAYLSCCAELRKLPQEDRIMECRIKADFSDINLSSFEVLDADYERMGFIQLKDIREYLADGTLADGFQRIYIHPDLVCFGWISFLRTGNNPYQCLYGIQSYYSEEFMLSSTNNITLGLLCNISHPRHLTFALPNTRPDDLFAHHCRIREQLIQKAKLNPVTDMSQEFYFAQRQQSVTSAYTRIMRKGHFRMFLSAFQNLHRPPTVWLGEMRGKIDLSR